MSGAGGNVYSALQALDELAAGETIEAVLAWADSCSEPRADWPAACEQARRYLASVDLAAWVAAQARSQAGEGSNDV